MIKLVKKLLKDDKVKFFIAGGFGFVLEFFIMTLLTEKFKIHYNTSSSIAFIIGVIVNYYLCKYWIFENVKKQSILSLLFFIISSVIGLLLTIVLMDLFVESVKIHYMISKFIAALIVMVFNYVAKKLILVKK